MDESKNEQIVHNGKFLKWKNIVLDILDIQEWEVLFTNWIKFESKTLQFTLIRAQGDSCTDTVWGALKTAASAQHPVPTC